MTEEGSGGGFSWGLTPGGANEPPDEAADAPPHARNIEAPASVETPAAAETAPSAETPASAERPAFTGAPAAEEPPRLPEPEPAREPPPVSPEPGGAVEALFGDTQFQEYEEGLDPAQRPLPGRRAPKGTRVAAPVGFSRTQKILITVAGGLVAVLALVALFALGTKLPRLLAASAVASATPTPTRTPTATPTPTPTARPAGPVAAGVHGWNELLGGECLDPYTSPWAEKFTVVDCALAHPAQMVFRGTFDPTTTPTFPGAAALQARLSLLCAAPGVLNLAVAGQYSDAQVQGSYPVTEAQWAAGQHDYFCFISRSSGQPMIGSLALAGG